MTDLETERLILRRFTLEDEDELYELDSDPEVVLVFNGGLPTPMETIRSERLPRYASYHDDHPGLGYWAAIEKESGAFIGLFLLRPRGEGDPAEPELGYRLRKAAWGRGFATEGARALIDYAFERTTARRVCAETLAVHAASRRVLEKAGLRFVRSFFQEWPYSVPGDEHGDVEYALSRDDWQPRPPDLSGDEAPEKHRPEVASRDRIDPFGQPREPRR